MNLHNYVFDLQETINFNYGYAKVKVDFSEIEVNKEIFKRYSVHVLMDETCTEYIYVSLPDYTSQSVISFLIGMFYQ